ncbi:alpha/beta fold hydrolase [Streptomyces sp. NPDC002073]|uniref:alpha/beta fold hydrolase n=1 Tax=Streptomyces sp. NBC_00239 TaxID=2903640 RepID=UPI002E2C58F9|nr:alpha/beta fold hydrolase [Streptomyces sp. NBC_00239]
MNSFTANGATLRYDDLGPADGLPVLLVHGHPFNRSLWAPQAAALTAAGHRVILPDLRGYGESEVVPGKTLLAEFAADLAALLDHLGVPRAVVGGVSMGGQIAMEFHLAHPERVLALVLSDTSPVAETPEGKAFRAALAERLLAEGMDGYADEVIGKMIAPYHVTGQPEVAAHVLGMMKSTAPEGAAAALRGRAERPDYRASLALLKAPALIVVGADDAYTPVTEARALHELVPQAALVVIEEAGHLPGAEQPARFNEALLAFLETVPAG